MALYDLELLGNITRMELATGYLYHFPLEIIETNTHGAYMIIRPRGQSRTEQVDFADVLQSFGASDIRGYVDEIAVRGFYKSAELDQGRLSLGDGTQGSNYEVEAAEVLSQMNKTLDKILFVLKGISE